MADPNTRQGKRTPVTLKIKFKSETLEQFIERYAVDVSQGGIFIRTKEPLAVGTQMRFEFQLRDASPLIGGEGTVVWTRENDPSRPAIAPGMGVRFDRLAEGSQTVLERILAEKAKQAPQRPSETKPPMFTDTPTKVAPAVVQDALLGNEQSKATQRRRPSSQPASFNDQHTPLPKPMPFHSDADEFPEEAFEEATKVRALDELVAQTAKDPAGGAAPAEDDLAVRRAKEPSIDPNKALESGPVPRPIADGAEGRDSAPGLPSPPAMESAKVSSPRLLDTTPSPRSDSDPLPAKTKLGIEPGRSAMPSSPPPLGIKDAPTRPTGLRAVANESSGSARMPAHKSSSAPLAILLLLLVAIGGAAVWFFVFRDKASPEKTIATPTPGSSQGSAGSAGSAGSLATNPGSAGSAEGSAKPAPKVEIVDTVIAVPDLKDKATVEIVGTDQKGPAPFTAKLEKDKSYQVKVSAAGFQTNDLEVKGGDKPDPVKLVAKPKVIKVTSDPETAVILVDGYAVKNAFTPHEVELSKQQAARKAIRIRVQKAGYKAIERVITSDSFKEGDTQVAASLHVKLEKAAVRPPPNPGSGSGSASGSAGSAKEPGAGSDAAGSATPPAGSGSAAPTPEPEPEFAP